jgi:tetratricopeptide (TPR) repeat protein
LANLGALDQSQRELSIYHWPEWSIQDALRRSPQIDLAPAVRNYQAALALDPGNVTAQWRLGLIELSLGQYELAGGHLQAAYRIAPGRRAIRQLLGEYYAITGEPQRAAELWQAIDLSQGQMYLRLWWYDFLGEQQRSQWLQQAVTLVK